MPRALITGASSGIGAEYARQLAAKGYDLILTARREERLVELGNTLQSQHGIKYQVVQADLSIDDDIQRVCEVAINIDLLINNAGFGTNQDFATGDIKRETDMIRVHIDAAIRLIHAVLPDMMEKGYGRIINVSSIASFFVSSSTYGASKLFLNSFSKSIQSDMKAHGVLVQALCPGYTYTQFHDTPAYDDFSREQIPKWMWMTSEEVVHISLSKMDDSKVVVVPGFKYRLLVFLMRTGFMPIISRFRRMFYRKK